MLYTVGFCSARAGQLSPLCLLLVSGVLFFYRYVCVFMHSPLLLQHQAALTPPLFLCNTLRIYGEACTALPLNGGAYNVLLNTTSKIVASLAACLTILSYTATAVVSASESVYGHTSLPRCFL